MSKKGGKSTPKQLDKDNRVTPTNEFIPGIPDAEWEFLNELDQRDAFIGDTVNDLVQSSLDIVANNWIENYAVVEAVDQVCAILEDTIDVFFISHDQGNADFDITWGEDTPPKPSALDSWTNGRVPVVRAPAERPESRMSATSSSMATVDSGKLLSDQTTNESFILGPSAGPVHLVDKQGTTHPTESPTKGKPKLKPFKRYTGRVKSAKLTNLTTPLAKSEEQLLKSQISLGTSDETGDGLPKNFNATLKMMKNSNSIVEYDQSGNVTRVSRIPSNALPKLQRPRPLIKFEEEKIGHPVKVTENKPKRKKRPSEQKATREKKTGERENTFVSGRIIDNIDLQKGVTLREGDLIRANPNKKSPRVVDLAPIRLVQPQKINASDIVK